MWRQSESGLLALEAKSKKYRSLRWPYALRDNGCLRHCVVFVTAVELGVEDTLPCRWVLRAVGCHLHSNVMFVPSKASQDAICKLESGEWRRESGADGHRT